MLTVLSALAEPTRLAAMRLLDDGAEHCVCELMRGLGATQSRTSRHMRVLKQAGLVVDRRDAQWVRYRVNPDLSPAVTRLLDAALTLDPLADEVRA
ncbi:MAG: metalloregulator ArsR/SmtB family transcription factor [Rhodobacter sp.]|nr:metalloregulator ArsR/SmtB family transcription factor [Paracoccaceae bacterium]MCC0077111.1 metalloregulator ArsR/SmtB family transcription factor [Rhodobacter sp.]